MYFPDLVFVYENYVRACGKCNRKKGEQFGILNAAGQLISLTRQRGVSPQPPPKGKPVLLNPRREDATQWLMLDLRDTFEFASMLALSSTERIRADYLIKVLPLNDDTLVAARREAHDNYRARLVEYVVRREAGASVSELRKLINALQRMQHPTVWFEIKRQSSRLKDWQPLFAQAPEALTW